MIWELQVSYITRKMGGLPGLNKKPEQRNPFFSISFVDENTGWAAGQSGTIIATKDGGKTWIPQKSPRKEHLLCLQFTDKNHGVAVGDWRKVVYTNNSGNTWMDVSLEEDILLNDIEFVSESGGQIRPTQR